MHQPLVVCAGILGLSLILSVAIFVFGRLRIEQQRTLQRLVDRGISGDELVRSAGLAERGARDLRRGLLLIGIGLSWSTVTFLIGGRAWILGVFPVTIGLVYVLFRVLDGRPR
ncbi:MAG TPA: hypothetical protein VJU18_13685 [Vicinamibacteria bacterium]|nr:hypothetical protein [Vicinamibacteria bacterium]